MDLYNAMFPSHLIHIPPQPAHNEGRTYTTHPTAFEVFRVVSRSNDMRYDHRKNFILHSNSSVNLTHNTNKRMSSQYYAKTFYNTTKQEYWKTKNTGENKRLEHGSSAPCLISAVSNESVDSGISRSPTPNKQQSVNSSISYDQTKPYHVLPSLEKKNVNQERQKGLHRAPKVYSKINSHMKFTEADSNRSVNMVQNGHNVMFTNRHPLQRREVQSQAKRRTTYNRNMGPFFKNRRMYNLLFNYPSPYPYSVYGEDALTERTCQNCFAQFHSENVDINDAQRSGRPPEIETSNVKAIVDQSPTKLVQEIAIALNVSHKRVEKHLHKLS